MSAVLSTVYNNYLTTYVPKGLNRCNIHKQSELRSIYHSIVNMNREAPWYLPTNSRDTQRYAVELKESARKLHDTIARLGEEGESGLFSKKSAFSSAPETVSAVYIGSQAASSQAPALEIEVHNLASSQENMGVFLKDTPVQLSPGVYSFDVAINDMNYEFQFAVNEGETNREMQKRLIRLINNAEIRLHASLITDEDTSALRLTSEATGLPPGKSELFHISDEITSRSSGTVEYLGLDYVSRRPANAQFLINGKEHSSVSNQYTVDKIYELELKGTTSEEESIQIGLKTDLESLTDNVLQLTNGYNDFLQATSLRGGAQQRSRQLIREFSGIASAHRSSLEAVGIRVTEENLLEVDEDLLHRTVQESEDISDVFSYLKPFASTLLNKSKQVSLNPMEYVDKVMVAYKNPGHNFNTPYTTSAYSGMLFNGYC